MGAMGAMGARGAMNDACLICARLLREGAVPRRELPQLDYADVRRDVEERLNAVGLVLATSVYSDHVGLRLSPDVTEHAAFDAASNLGLKSDACALLVVLWARLVLQKRTAVETRTLPGQGALFDADRAREARDFTPSVRLNTVVREFGKVIGSRSRIKGLVSQLRKLGFLAGRGEVLEAGPLLELGIDGERMVGFIRREVLAELLERKEAPAEGDEGAPEQADVETAVLAALKSLGGSAGMSDIERATGERRLRLRKALSDLVDRKEVARTGERGATQYHLTES